jgi:hypothetical protein
MFFLDLRAYMRLIRLEVYLLRGDFSSLYQKVRSYPVAKKATDSSAVERICSAVDLACIWYWKRVLCLERSAVTTGLLKDYGFPAQMVIGAQQMPFKAHAWVEIEGRIVNDRPYIREMYVELDRC